MHYFRYRKYKEKKTRKFNSRGREKEDQDRRSKGRLIVYRFVREMITPQLIVNIPSSAAPAYK